VLEARSFWRDEAVTVLLMRLDFLAMLRAIPGSEGAPPFYHVVAWLWCRLFGTGEAGVRALSALIGTVTIPVICLAAARLVSLRAGLTAAALATVSPLLVWFSLDARPYVLLVLLGALSFLYFIEYLTDRSQRSAALWAVSSVLALATHYYAFFLIAPEAV
jgi:uncharacterized membrane protein